MKLMEEAQAAQNIVDILRGASGDKVRTEACLNALEAVCFRMKREASEMMACAEGVDRAIRVEGPYPGYHRSVQLKHMMEWPSLWVAIGDLQDWVRRVSNG